MKRKNKKYIWIGIIIAILVIGFLYFHFNSTLSITGNTNGNQRCYSNADCSDNNPNTIETCVSPGLPNSICKLS